MNPRLTLRAFLAALALILLPGRARAQEELNVVLHPITARTVNAAKGILGLDAEQVGLVRDLYQGYRAAYKTAMEDAQVKIQALAEKHDDPKQQEKIREQTRGLVAAAEKLDAGVLDDIKALLSQEQAGRFPALERARRRDWMRGMRVVSGDNVDLIDLLDAQKVAWRTDKALAPLVEEYDLALDRLITQRQAALRELFEMIMKIDNPLQLDENAFKGTVTKMYDLGKQMRDCNRGAARRLGQALAPDARQTFEAEVLRRTYPRVYGPCKATRVLDAAAKLQDLSDAQRAELTALAGNYTREAAAANTAWAGEIERAHEELIADPMKSLNEQTSNQDALAKPRAAREELDTRYAQRVEQLLNKDQNARLPPPPRPSRHEGRSEVEPDLDEGAVDRWIKGEDDPDD